MKKKLSNKFWFSVLVTIAGAAAEIFFSPPVTTPFTTQCFLSQTDHSRPLLWPKRVPPQKKSPKCKTLQNIAKSLVSEPLVAIFRIYTRFASQRNDSCLKRTLLESFCGQNPVTEKVPNASKPSKHSKIIGFRASSGHFQNIGEICFTTQWFLSQTDPSGPPLWPKTGHGKSPQSAKPSKPSKILGFRCSRGHFRNLREICFTTQWFLSQTDPSRPLLWPARSGSYR